MEDTVESDYKAFKQLCILPADIVFVALARSPLANDLCDLPLLFI